jgi:sulfane dehydrogenase subunit SoxC
MTKPTNRQECNRRIPPAIFEGRRSLWAGRHCWRLSPEVKRVPGDTANLPPNVPEWMKTPGDPMGSQPYGTPSPFEKDVIKNISKTLSQYLSASGRTPLQDLDGIITPNGLFYERHHGGVPTIDPAQHRLMLHGLVDRPLIFTMDDVRRFPSESYIYFLECSGNPEYKKPYGKTASDLVGLVSCAEWTGVSLKLVLQEAGLQPGAKWVVPEGADAAAMTRSIPIEKCLDDAMLVYSQNGERLRPQQGYPLRLLVPGFEGGVGVSSDDYQFGIAERNSNERRLFRSSTSVQALQPGAWSKSIQLETRA